MYHLTPKSSDMERQRAQNESEVTVTPCIAEDTILAQAAEHALSPDDEMQRLSPSERLGRLLSRDSIVSSSSLFAEKQQANSFREIGKGACGIVYEQPDMVTVLKVARTLKADQLWNDYLMHTCVMEAFREWNITDTLVPNVLFYISHGKNEATKDLDWWNENGSRFPDDPILNDVLVSERILPLSSTIRGSLIDLYCPDRIKDSARKSQANKDCLVRVYLGRRDKRPRSFFTLRNFGLCVDMMEELGLDIHGLARDIAEALAVMHWGAMVDGRDVEFVLGSGPTMSQTPAVVRPLTYEELKVLRPCSTTVHMTTRNFTKRKTQLWVIDFNQCSKIPMTKEGIASAVEAYLINDPYFPRPLAENTKDRDLWNTFREAYVEKSNVIVDGKSPEIRALPGVFLELLVAAQRKRLAGIASARARS